MTQAIITSDYKFFENISQDEQEKFFRDSYDFMCERYGKENIVSAIVHLDEATPHMHVNFVPVTSDGRLSAKSLFNPVSLKNLQTDFFTEVASGYGLERGIENHYQKHLTVAEFKLKTAVEKAGKVIAESKAMMERADTEVICAGRKLEEINTAIKRKTEIWEKRESELKEKHHKAMNQLENQHSETMKRYKSEEESAKSKLAKIKNDYKTLQAENKKAVCDVNKVRAIQPNKSLMGIQNITIEQINWLKELAETLFLSQTTYRKKRDELDYYLNEYNEALKENIRMGNELRWYANENERLNPIVKAFKRLPEEQQETLLHPPKPQQQRTVQRTVTKRNSCER
jgi:hypothetical protein